jgi:hypothetical protein
MFKAITTAAQKIPFNFKFSRTSTAHLTFTCGDRRTPTLNSSAPADRADRLCCRFPAPFVDAQVSQQKPKSCDALDSIHTAQAVTESQAKLAIAIDKYGWWWWWW